MQKGQPCPLCGRCNKYQVEEEETRFFLPLHLYGKDAKDASLPVWVACVRVGA